MMRCIAILALMFTIVVGSLSAALAENITYFIEPYTVTNERAPGDEYRFSGTITTNGTSVQ